MLKKRSDVLDELAVYSQNVTLQDSLLALSKLSPEEQQKVADRLVKELKDKEKKAAEEAALQALASRPDAAGSQLKSVTYADGERRVTKEIVK
jgi:GTPase involved in cell partitioning and DNA repair